MLLKFRQKVLAWLRESDDYDDRGHYLYPNLVDTSNEPVPDYSSSPARRPRGTRKPWPPTANMKTKTQTQAKGLGVEFPINEDSIDSNFRSRGIFLKLINGTGGVVLETRQFDDRNGIGPLWCMSSQSLRT